MLWLGIYFVVSFISGLTLLGFVQPPTRATYEEFKKRGILE